MSNDELVELNASSDLTDIAKRVLSQELENRGIKSRELDARTKTRAEEIEQNKNILGMKWLKYCAYFQYPVSGILILWIPLNVPMSKFLLALAVTLPITVTFFAIAWGLIRRRLWAWRANWAVILLACVAFINEQMSESLILISIALVGTVLFIWANYVYWKNRRHLFT